MPTSVAALTPLFVLLAEIIFLAIIALLPLKVPRGSGLLTISVVPDFLRSREAQRLIRRYRLVDILLALAAAAIAGFAWSRQSNFGLIVAPLFQIAGLGMLWTLTWRAVLPHRNQQPIIRTASLTEIPGPTPAWYAVTLGALLPLALAAVTLAVRWSSIPERFPIHYDLLGQPNRWSTRTPFDVFWPIGLAVGLLLWIAFCGWLLARYSLSSSSKPRVLSFTLEVLRAVAWVLGITMSFAALLPLLSMHGASVPYFLVGMLVLMIAFFLYITARAWRIFRTIPSDQSTPAQRWIAGIIYYNPDDAALFVPKRSGMGYTFNFARPAAWVLMCGVLLLALIPLIWSMNMHHR